MSVNKVILVGNLGNDPELRYTPSNRAVTELRIATSENWTGQDGQRHESTEWHSVVVWGRQAENCERFLRKGRQVYIEGRLTTRDWVGQDGQKRYKTEVVAQNVQFLSGGRSDEAGEERSEERPENRSDDRPDSRGGERPRGRSEPQPARADEAAPGMSDAGDDYGGLNDDIPF